MKAFRTRCNLLRSALLIFLSLLPAALPAAETVTYYHTDALGSIVAATDEQGAVLWRESYRPYGERIDRTVPTSDHRLFYTGKPHDDATRFTYFGARYYDPLVGRFIGMDPVGVDPNNPQSFSRYGYANDNPYRFWDPDGMESEEVEEYLQARAEYAAQVRKVGEDVYKTAEGAAGFANPVVGAVQGYSGRFRRGCNWCSSIWQGSKGGRECSEQCR